MNSSDLAQRGFGSWGVFNFANRKRFLFSAPRARGVYCIRAKRSLPRLVGNSDIMYFGKATNAKGLQGRLGQYFHPGHLQTTNLGIRKRIEVAPDDFEVAWTTCESEEAKRLEARLVREFLSDHRERPPWNRNRPWGI
jgi:hypothetical protein